MQDITEVLNDLYDEYRGFKKELKTRLRARNLRVRGHAKALCHLMFGVVALAADTLARLFSQRCFPLPA